MSVLLWFLVISLLIAMSEPVSGHSFLTPPCCLYLSARHARTLPVFFGDLWALREIPSHFILSKQPVHLLLLSAQTV